MVKTILGYGIASLLAVSLLAGTGYILLNPTDAQAERNLIDGQEQGQGRGRGGDWQDDIDMGNGTAAYGQGRGNERSGLEAPAQVADGRSEATQGRGAFDGGAFGGAGAFDGRGQGQGRGENETVRTVEWETLTGEVTALGSDITIQTAEGQVLVGMGQSAYRESFGLEVGDEITVLG
ncbi:MAG: hypothetical protein KKC18_10785, partial [Chloroflexi bacterium]|nr:hypothetical protein [Chloroflexota bacterium]